MRPGSTSSSATMASMGGASPTTSTQTNRNAVTDIDDTHDPALRSFVPGADSHSDFPIQNLPLGIFSPPGGTPRGCVAIGEMVLYLPAVLSAGLLSGAAADAAQAASGPTLNALFALGTGPRRALPPPPPRP